MSETIHVDPVTGGRKGEKPVRYDLIPGEFDVAIGEYQNDSPKTALVTLNGSGDACCRLRDLLCDFWEGDGGEEALVEAAALISWIAGGWVAVRAGVARVYGKGALKYDDNNWRKGYRWSLSYAAALRHLHAIEEGRPVDEESGELHLFHVWWHLAALWTFATEGLGTDNRPRMKEAA